MKSSGTKTEPDNNNAAPSSLAGLLPGVPVPANEQERLAALRSYHILDTAEEKDFDDLTALASVICQTPIALVSLVDEDRQWFKSHRGIAATETPKEYSFCAHAIASPNHIMLVPDARTDDRFLDNPLVTGETNISFYAGVPLINDDGFALGSLCVADHHSRELSGDQINALMVLAKQVVDKLELKRKTSLLEDANKQLQQSYNTLQALHRQLSTSEVNFRNLVQQAPVAISILQGRELVIESANEEILRLWNKSAAVLGQPLAAALPELRVQPFLEILDNVYISGKPYYGYEAKITFVTGNVSTEGFFNFVYQPMRNDAGNITAIMVVATEVTEQVAARNAVNDSNERLALALDAGSLGSYDADMQTGLMVSSEQCKKNFGLEKDALFNFPDMLVCMLPEYREYVMEQVNTAIANNTLYQAEYIVVWPDGSRHWIAAQGKVKQAVAGSGIRLVGVTQNITERKETDKRKDTFLSIVSHELKTPITSLQASLQLLDKIKDQPLSAVFPLLIQTSLKSTAKINGLVDDLLNMHRFSENQLKLNKTWFTVWDMLHVCCNHVRVAGKHELIIEGGKDILVYADEHRIDQVIVNFVNNAVKYAPQSRNIILGISRNDKNVTISVKDFGPGIAPEHLPHIFDRYWRADHKGVAYTGLGLGLYICAEIIKRHDGQIGVVSELGKGSSFWFTLPCADTPG